jgi:hypothetical protein
MGGGTTVPRHPAVRDRRRGALRPAACTRGRCSTCAPTRARASWLDIQKAAAAAEGRNNPLFKGSEGMYHDVILHKHRGVIRFNDYGAGGNVNACRNLSSGGRQR